MKDLQITLKERFKDYCDDVFIDKEVNAEQCKEIADDYAIEFAKWCRGNYDFIKKEDYTILLKKFKKEKGL
jgi:hypothetical protein